MERAAQYGRATNALSVDSGADVYAGKRMLATRLPLLAHLDR